MVGGERRKKRKVLMTEYVREKARRGRRQDIRCEGEENVRENGREEVIFGNMGGRRQGEGRWKGEGKAREDGREEAR